MILLSYEHFIIYNSVLPYIYKKELNKPEIRNKIMKKLQYS